MRINGWKSIYTKLILIITYGEKNKSLDNR